MPLRGIVLLSLLIASLPACFVRPLYGLVVWMIISFANPQSALLYWPTAAAFPWALAVAIPTLAGILFFHSRDLSRIPSREVFLIAILWAWFTITSFVSTHTATFVHHADETWYRWGFVSKVLLMAVMMIPVVATVERLRVLLLTIAGCFGFFVLKSFPFVLMSGGQFRLYGPPNSMIADNNDFGLALNMTLPLFFFLAQTEARRWLKVGFALLFLMTIPAILFTYSRGAMVGLVTLAILMIVRLKQRLLVAPVIVLGLLFGLLLAPESWRHRMDPTRDDAIDSSARSRLVAWNFAYNLAADYPFSGGGFATFTPQLFSTYASSMDIHGAHSVYFQLLGEHGYPGLLLYLTLVGSCFWTAAGIIREARNRDDEIIVLYANMLRFSIVGFLIPGLFLGRAYFDYFFTIIACLVILKKAAADRWDAIDEAPPEEEEEAAPATTT